MCASILLGWLWNSDLKACYSPEALGTHWRDYPARVIQLLLGGQFLLEPQTPNQEMLRETCGALPSYLIQVVCWVRNAKEKGHFIRPELIEGL